MILSNLYEEVLINPTRRGANELFIVSGYSSATFANRHLKEASDSRVNLIIGMPGKRSDHLGFVRLYDEYKDRFQGYYLKGSPPVHSKAYGWFKDGEPLSGFSGSANYSKQGFFEKEQINQVSNENPTDVRRFFESLLDRSIEIKDYKFDYSDLNLSSSQLKNSVIPGDIFWEIPGKRVSISFLDRSGNLPQRSGLNWGQRPDYNRGPNEAYLSIKKDSRKEGFLPPKAETFTLITDDNHSMDCVVAQGGRKSIESTNNNSEMGEYIRKRIGVPFDDPVLVENLIEYGRTDFTIEKINEETFLLDLSTNKK